MEELATLQARLSDPDESTRAYAAEDAGYDDRRDAVGALVARLLVESSRCVREAIVAALSRITDQGVVPAVCPLLSVDDAYLRNAAVGILQRRGEPAIAAMEAHYALSDADVRKLALDVASNVAGEAAERLLLRGLDDQDGNVRIAAIEYLADRASETAKARIERLLLVEEEPMAASTALAALETIGDGSSWEAANARYGGVDGVPPFILGGWLRLAARVGPADLWTTLITGIRRLGAAQLDDALDVLETYDQRFPQRPLPADVTEHLEQSLATVPSRSAAHRRLQRYLHPDAAPDRRSSDPGPPEASGAMSS